MKFSDLQAKLAALREQSQQHPKPTLKTIKSEAADSIQEINPTIPINTTTHSGTDRHGNSITYNSRQQEAINLILSGQSCVIIGAAGTGKTTIQKASTAGLLQSTQLIQSANNQSHYPNTGNKSSHQLPMKINSGAILVKTSRN